MPKPPLRPSRSKPPMPEPEPPRTETPRTEPPRPGPEAWAGLFLAFSEGQWQAGGESRNFFFASVLFLALGARFSLIYSLGHWRAPGGTGAPPVCAAYDKQRTRAGRQPAPPASGHRPPAAPSRGLGAHEHGAATPWAISSSLGLGFRVYTLSRSHARVDFSGALLTPQAARGVHICPPPLARPKPQHFTVQGFSIVFNTVAWRGPFARQSQRCHVCAWGRRSALHNMCWFHNVRSVRKRRPVIRHRPGASRESPTVRGPAARGSSQVCPAGGLLGPPAAARGPVDAGAAVYLGAGGPGRPKAGHKAGRLPLGEKQVCEPRGLYKTKTT